MTLVQPSYNNPPHVTDITVGKTERKCLRNWSSTARQQISHTHIHAWRKKEKNAKNCMLLPEGILHAALFTSPSRQQVAFILLQPPCSVTLNHSEIPPPPPSPEWKITYKTARPAQTDEIQMRAALICSLQLGVLRGMDKSGHGAEVEKGEWMLRWTLSLIQSVSQSINQLVSDLSWVNMLQMQVCPGEEPCKVIWLDVTVTI